MNFPTQMYIDGTLTDGSAKREVANPATETAVAAVAVAGMGDVERALQAAKAAFPIWATAPIAERQAWMRKLRDEVVANEDWLRSCVHHEMGKPSAQTEEDWDRLVASLDFYAEEIARVHDYGIADRAGTHTHRMVYATNPDTCAISTRKYAPISSAISLNFFQSTIPEYAEKPAIINFGLCS